MPEDALPFSGAQSGSTEGLGRDGSSMIPMDIESPHHHPAALEHRRSTRTFAECFKAPPGTESTDFDLHESRQYLQHVTNMKTFDRKLKGGIRWILLISVGMCTGIVGACIDKAVHGFFELRGKLNEHLLSEGYGWGTQYLAYVGACLGLAGVAGFLVCYVEPLAAGSGIPEVKCYLNGVHLPRVVDLKTLLAKAPGVMFSVSAGMPCGKEGPMIHSGSCIGGVMSSLGVGPLLRPYRADVEVRDFVTAGASSGVAAAFGAPVGGILFAIEEGATHFNPLIMLRSFVCCTAATLTVRFLLTSKAWGTMGSAAPLSFGHFEQSHYQIYEVPIFMLIGVIGGLMGAAFNAANTHLTKWRMRNVPGKGHRRYAEVFLVTFIISSIMFWMPVLFSCADGKCTTNAAEFSPAGQLFRAPGTKNIERLFHCGYNTSFARAGNCGHIPNFPVHSGSTAATTAYLYEEWQLLVFGLIYYILACWCYGLGLPSGLFVPSLLTGATFGRIVGQLVQQPFGLEWERELTSDPGVYALMGATAMLSGMARITLSLAVILMEASGTTQWALPIFVVTICSKWAGDFFTIGLYDIHIELKHVPILEATPDKEFISIRARDVMTKNLRFFNPVETVKNLLDVIQSCDHHSFPVLQNAKTFVGLMKRDTVLQVLWRGKAYGCLQEPTASLLNPAPMVPFKDERQLKTIDDILKAFTTEDLEKRIDLMPYVNEGCFTIPEHAALTRVYKLFRNMGLRHLPVLSPGGESAGIITRKDLILAHEEHLKQEGSAGTAVQAIPAPGRGGARQSLLQAIQ